MKQNCVFEDLPSVQCSSVAEFSAVVLVACLQEGCHQFPLSCAFHFSMNKRDYSFLLFSLGYV